VKYLQFLFFSDIVQLMQQRAASVHPINKGIEGVGGIQNSELLD